MINREKRVAKKITNLLNKRGFLVEQHNSKSSKSIYLRIDKGAIPSIRISDHKGYNNDNCKFNVIRNYKGAKKEVLDNRVIRYYNFNNIGRLISDVELERNSRIIIIGYSRYNEMLREKENNRKRPIKSHYYRDYQRAA